MQRNKTTNKKSAYVRSGLPGHQAPGGKKQGNAKRIVQLVIIAAFALILCILAFYGISNLFRGAGEPVRLNARPTDNIQPFGENVLIYDGMTLHCVSPGGDAKWTFMLGANADYATGNGMVVAWTGSQLHVLDKNGVPSFNDQMDGVVRFARIGATYVAASIGGDKESHVRVMTHTGSELETISQGSLYPIDIGFFAKGQYMWVLSIDIEGNVPISHIATYEPGHLSTGAVDINDELVYKVYSQDNLVMAVDTSMIQAYNYKCVEQTGSSVLVYGWQAKHVRQAGKNTYVLLERMSKAELSSTFSELRLVTNYKMDVLRLLSPCFASGLGEKGVYAFGTNVVYYIPYGSGALKTQYLKYGLTDFICMLDGGRAVMVTGNDVFIMKLPT